MAGAVSQLVRICGRFRARLPDVDLDKLFRRWILMVRN
jgi:hypothetical protein